jgi:hypothetical protein
MTKERRKLTEKKMPEEMKVRFLCQGILMIPADQLPSGWNEMDAATKWNWLQEWWNENVTEDMLKKALITDDAPFEPGPGLLEEYDGEEYHTVAQSNEYFGWWNCENASAMHEE